MYDSHGNPMIIVVGPKTAKTNQKKKKKQKIAGSDPCCAHRLCYGRHINLIVPLVGPKTTKFNQKGFAKDHKIAGSAPCCAHRLCYGRHASNFPWICHISRGSELILAARPGYCVYLYRSCWLHMSPLCIQAQPNYNKF